MNRADGQFERYSRDEGEAETTQRECSRGKGSHWHLPRSVEDKVQEVSDKKGKRRRGVVGWKMNGSDP